MQITDCRVAVVNASASGNNTIISPTTPASAGNTQAVGGIPVGHVRVWQVLLNGAAANVLQFQSGASTAVGPQIVFTGAGSSATLPATGAPWFQTVPGQALVLNLTTATAVTGSIYYTLG